MSDVFRCESSHSCQHIIPDEVYKQLSDWCYDREADLFICHVECVEGLVILKHEGVWCVVAKDPEG